MTPSAKKIVRRAVDSRFWKPAHLSLMWAQVSHRRKNAERGYTDRDHLREAVHWLERAQDATDDGGISGRYRLNAGWTSSYPETTGYIIPTLLALAEQLNDPRFRDRARRCVEFLLALQLESGAFPGGEVRSNVTKPSPFNTAQILAGLTAWHKHSRDPVVLAAAQRAADWLVSVQDADGAYRQYTYLGVATTYTAHASCWLAEFGRYLDHDGYLRAASRHLDWVLSHQDPDTSWFNYSGFNTEDHANRQAVTHTIAYTVWGVLASAIALGREDALASAHRAAERVARRLELGEWLPGKLDHRWRAAADHACLTGNAQMALIWLRLHDRTGDARLLNAALKAIDLVKMAQPMDSVEPGIQGGIPGSDPIWGDYLRLAFPNWAAKFFVDALIAKQAAMQRFVQQPKSATPVRADLPRSAPDLPASGRNESLRVVLYTRRQSRKVPKILQTWAEWGFEPAYVVVEQTRTPRVADRLRQKVRDDGFSGLYTTLTERKRRASVAEQRKPERRLESEAKFQIPNLEAICVARGIPMLEVGSLDSADGVAAVRALNPDLAIYAGGGILRAPILAVPRLGTLNAHMGILPTYRGMNVAEWAALLGGPVGCTVHLIDPGIDTGDILCVTAVDPTTVRSIAELRSLVDRHQLAVLGAVVRYVLARGQLPPRHPQTPAEGRQYFRMHAELASIVEAQLQTQGSAVAPHTRHPATSTDALGPLCDRRFGHHG